MENVLEWIVSNAFFGPPRPKKIIKKKIRAINTLIK
jgi:hypothetical protein